MIATPYTVDGLYCMCLNVHSFCLKPHPRMSAHNRIRLFIKYKAEKSCLNDPQERPEELREDLGVFLHCIECKSRTSGVITSMD